MRKEKQAEDTSLMTLSLIYFTADRIGFPLNSMEHLSGKALIGHACQTKRISQTEDTGKSQQGNSRRLIKLRAKIENTSEVGIVVLHCKYVLSFPQRTSINYNDMFGKEKEADGTSLIITSSIDFVANGIGFPLTPIEHLSDNALVIHTRQTKTASQTEDTEKI